MKIPARQIILAAALFAACQSGAQNAAQAAAPSALSPSAPAAGSAPGTAGPVPAANFLPATSPAPAAGADQSAAGRVSQQQPPPPNPNLSMMPELDPIEGKISANFLERYWAWILGLSLAAAAALYAIFRPRLRPPPTPYETAISRLSRIEASGEKLNAREYAAEISQCVRDYIAGAHNIPAPSRTTEEFLQMAARSLVFDKTQRGQLERILKLADMAKFAMHSFRADERSAIYSEALGFVQNDNRKSEVVKGIKDEPQPDMPERPENSEGEKIELSDGEK